MLTTSIKCSAHLRTSNVLLFNKSFLNNLVPFPQVRYTTMAPSILLRQEDKVTVSSSGSDEIAATFGSAALDNDVDLGGLTASSAVIVW